MLDSTTEIPGSAALKYASASLVRTVNRTTAPAWASSGTSFASTLPVSIFRPLTVTRYRVAGATS